jgi:hypothetical protein
MQQKVKGPRYDKDTSGVEAEQKCLGIIFQSPKLALLIIAIRTEDEIYVVYI